MTLDQSIALSLVPHLSRHQLLDRLRAADPALLDAANARLDEAREARAAANAAGIVPLAWNDPQFPAALFAIPDAPPLLWCRGAVGALAAPAVAIVGSRAASAVALETATRLAADLAVRGIVVVSGLARGVDSAAHRGALRGGRTIAVLGSGIGRIYPNEHVPLAAAIAQRGLVISEYPLHRAPLSMQFPQRNRLISGLSRAVVVIEAHEKSGSLITAGCALQQGREVMAVPGNVLSGRNRGGHALIRDGATIVECADDILEELGLATVADPDVADGSSAAGSTASQDPILRGMEAGQAYDLDALAALSGLPTLKLLPRLLDLQLQARVRRVEGGRFVRSA
jgi:DNA processing protein